MKKYVLVTGACINTGVAIVDKFASEGWNIVFTGRDSAKVDKAREEYLAKHPNTDIIGITLKSLINPSTIDEDGVDNMFATLDSMSITVSCVVLNAADLGVGIEIFNSPISDFMRVINTNMTWNYAIVERASRRMIDIGGGSTEIAVISLGGIVSNNSIRVAGDDLTADIQEYMYRQHNVKVSERMAERIKIAVGAALTDLGDDAPEDYIVRGPNRITALPMEVPVNYQEIAHCLEKSIAKIETAILSALENTPPELYADIVVNGIYLAGGGALLRGLDKRLTDKINIPFHIAEDPLLSVARGTAVALKNVDRFSFLMR